NTASLSDIFNTLSDTLSNTHSEPEDIRVQEIIQEAVASSTHEIKNSLSNQSAETYISTIMNDSSEVLVHEVLQISEDINALKSLLLELSILKKKYRAQFSILLIQQASILAVSLKMSTLLPAEK
ncbi:hypothetical protein CIHG_10506, partial [Coccidioides immitis H538.4]